MNNIKILVTLFVGIFIGYVMANVISLDANSQNNLTADMSTEAPGKIERVLITKKNIEKDVEQPSVKQVYIIEKDEDEVIEIYNTVQDTSDSKYQQLETAYQLAKNKIALLQLKLEEFDDSNVSTSQMEALVDEPFKGLINSFTGVTRDQIYNFHQAEEDADWGYNMQNNISDLINTHYEVNDINLVSVICKQQQCEIQVIQHADEAWNKISQDLMEQDWWTFTSTISSAGNASNSSNDMAIYTFLSI